MALLPDSLKLRLNRLRNLRCARGDLRLGREQATRGFLLALVVAACAMLLMRVAWHESQLNRTRDRALTLAKTRHVSPDALRLFDNYLRYRPDDAEVLSACGRMLAESEPMAAAVLLQRAVELNPDDTQSWRDLGDALYAGHRKRSARAAYSEYLRRVPDRPDANVVRQRLIELSRR